MRRAGGFCVFIYLFIYLLRSSIANSYFDPPSPAGLMKKSS